MSSARSVENLFVLATIGHQPFAFPIHAVREMVQMPKVTAIPQSNATVRGVINLRGSVIPVIDMRVRLGMVSCIQESAQYIAMMNAREEDHRYWLQDLELSVKDRRSFTLATDPHLCAFGKWYYSYDSTASTNRCMALDQILVQFENPHNRIHAIADEVLELEKAGDFGSALEIIEETRTTDLARMISLFEEARSAIKERSRELAMVIELEGKKLALVVDAVETVERLNNDGGERKGIEAAGLEDPIIEKICRRAKDSSLVITLNVGELFRAEAVRVLL